MLVKNDEYLEEAAESIYQANADDILMQKCRAREEAERYERIAKRTIEQLQEENAALHDEKVMLQDENQMLRKRIAELEG